MSRRHSSYRTIRTTEGILFHLFTDENGRNKPHSYTGPAVQYPKGVSQPDEYYIYGIKYDYLKWYELSRISKRSQGDGADFAE
jgi:hypothetical protein